MLLFPLLLPWPLLVLYHFALFRCRRIFRHCTIHSTRAMRCTLHTLSWLSSRKPREICEPPPHRRRSTKKTKANRKLPNAFVRLSRHETRYFFFTRILFPVSLDLSVHEEPPSSSSTTPLSAVSIPVASLHPRLQHERKNNRRCAIKGHPPLITRARMLLTLLLFSSLAINGTYAIPGSNFAILTGEASRDTTRQMGHVQTAIEQCADGIPIALAGNSPKKEKQINNGPHCLVADTDSIDFVLDTGANRIIVNDMKLLTDFSLSKGTVKGINGDAVSTSGKGKLQMPLKSNEGYVDNLHVEAIFVSTSPYNLLPPQLLLEELQKAGYTTNYAKHSTSVYKFQYKKNDKVRTLDVPINPNKLFYMRTNEGYRRFFARAACYCSEFEQFAGSTHVIEPDDDEDELPREHQETDLPREPPREHQAPGLPREPPRNQITPEPPREQPHTRTLQQNAQGQPNVIPFSDQDFENYTRTEPTTVHFPEAYERASLPPQDANLIQEQRRKARFMEIHEKLGHISYPKMKLLSKAGLIPRDLQYVDPPTCPGCAYAKAHRKRSNKKIGNRRPIKPATAPGQVVSVDQLVSPTPGFVPIHRGRPTKKRYIGATIFVDHFSGFSYVHLLTEMNAQTTVESKQAFERVAESHGVSIRHYHCDNGLFDTKLFKESIAKANQGISFCGVNAHHQNGKAEAMIKVLSTGARSSLLHAAHRWPKAINASLWPSAMKHYNNLRNALRRLL